MKPLHTEPAVGSSQPHYVVPVPLVLYLLEVKLDVSMLPYDPAYL